jgi:transglutaminase-like putative cysteine protease
LFIKRARYTLLPAQRLTLAWSWPAGLPDGTGAPQLEHGRISLETRDVAAFESEEYMPPEDALQMRVDFVYREPGDQEKDPAKFWARYGKDRYRRVERFTDQRRAMERAVAEIVQPGDPPVAKLRKLYARVQQVRNLSYERNRTEEEAKHDNIKHNDDVEDVWSRGYGGGGEITWLFLALVRAAGLQADAVMVSTRDRYFFKPAMMNASHLNTNVVRVRLDGEDLYLDPGTAFMPFGFLPWNETAVTGLSLDANGGSWITTPAPAASESRIAHHATFKLGADGALEGRVTVTYTGLEAAGLRIDERLEDETARKRFLEKQLAASIPAGSEVTLVGSPDWSSSSALLVAEFEVRVPGWGVEAGSRLLLPAAVFGSAETHAFRHAARLYPLYFAFPHQQDDDVTVALPPEFEVTSMPLARDDDGKVVNYRLGAENASGALRLRRQLAVHPIILPVQYYASWREFFQKVRAGDEQQVILSPAKHAAAR